MWRITLCACRPFRRERSRYRSRTRSPDRDDLHKRRSYPNTPIRRPWRSRSRSPSPRDRRERRDREGRHTRDDDYYDSRYRAEDSGRRRDRDRDSPYSPYSRRDEYERRYGRDDDLGRPRRGSLRSEDSRRPESRERRPTHRRYTSGSQWGSRDTHDYEHRMKRVSPSPSGRSHETGSVMRSPDSVARERIPRPPSPPRVEDSPKVLSPEPLVDLSIEDIKLDEKLPEPIPEEPRPEAMETDQEAFAPQVEDSPMLVMNSLSEVDTALINSIWDTRIDTLIQIEDIMAKKEELEGLLKRLQTSPTATVVAPMIERLKKQIAQATDILDKLWQRLLEHEVQIEEVAKQRVKTEKMQQEEAELLAVESMLEELKDIVEGKKEQGNNKEVVDEPLNATLVEEPEPEKESEQVQEQPQGEDGRITDDQVDELADLLEGLETEFDDFEFGYETSDFEAMVREQLEDLKTKGLLSDQPAKRLSEDERETLRGLEVELDKAEEWVKFVDQRLQQRNQEVITWRQAYTNALYIIEESEARLSNVMARTNELEQQLEALKSTGPQAQAEAQAITKHTEHIFNCVAEGIEGDWIRRMNNTRSALRAQFDALMDGQTRQLLDALRSSEADLWEKRKRVILTEIAKGLADTYRWQSEVLRWLGPVPQ
ncbi:hypothetical protein CPB86DRAFT_785006 [Serendipita vermifera]|nr:hypothetical protein CPB86DRAFT_785006 [Serendipita vermifera]